MKWPLVSIIVRSIDRPCLAEALRSVCEQDYPCVEVVLVAASGPGHSVPRLDRDDYPLRVVGTGRSLRRSEAANQGLAAASGEFLMFLDDDDRILPGHVSSLVRHIRENDRTPLVYAGVRCVDQQWVPTGREYRQPFSRVRLLAGNYIPIHAALFRRGLVESRRCRFDESLDFYEDWDFWLQLMQFGDFRYVDEVGAEYRVSGLASGFGVNYSADAHAIARAIAQKWLHAWNDPDRLEALAAIIEADNIRRNCESAIKQVEDADRQFRDADKRLRQLDKELSDWQSRCEALAAELDERNRALERIVQSMSWRVTAPLRWLGARVRKRG